MFLNFLLELFDEVLPFLLHLLESVLHVADLLLDQFVLNDHRLELFLKCQHVILVLHSSELLNKSRVLLRLSKSKLSALYIARILELKANLSVFVPHVFHLLIVKLYRDISHFDFTPQSVQFLLMVIVDSLSQLRLSPHRLKLIFLCVQLLLGELCFFFRLLYFELKQTDLPLLLPLLLLQGFHLGCEFLDFSPFFL